MAKKSFTVFEFFLVAIFLAACGPSEEELAGTSQAEITVSSAATQTATPSSTPEPTASFTPSPTPTSTFTPTPSNTPTFTPTNSPTFTPTPEIAMVYGNLQVRLIPYGDGAKVPEALGDLTLMFKRISEEDVFPVQITGPSGGYSQSLPAGTYEIETLEFSVFDVGVPTGWPSVLVPEKGCIYTGRLFLSYYRLPPGSVGEQAGIVTEISKASGQNTYMIYLESGSLVPESAGIDLPDSSERVEGSEDCEVELVSWGN